MALKDCCNCCELGKQTRKNGGECSPIAELNNECNGIFMDCCKSATSCKTQFFLHFAENHKLIVDHLHLFLDDDCTQHFCPNGQVCENTRSGPICKCPRGYEKDARSNHCIGKCPNKLFFHIRIYF